MHVESWRVGENLPTSLHGAQDVGPHFFGQLLDSGFDYFPGLRQRHFAAPRAASSAVTSVSVRRGGSHVSVLTVHPVSGREPRRRHQHRSKDRDDPSALPERLFPHLPQGTADFSAYVTSGSVSLCPHTETGFTSNLDVSSLYIKRIKIYEKAKINITILCRG